MDRRQAGRKRARELTSAAAVAEIADPALQRVARSYLRDEALPVMPKGGAKRSMLLAYLVTAFEPGLHYSEDEVNDIVGQWHPDVAMLRRYLVDEGLLDRADGQYWRCGGPL